LAKREHISVQHVLSLLQLADDDNHFGVSHLEKQHKWHIDEIHELDIQIERSKNHLHSVNDQIVSEDFTELLLYVM
jgi:hypothetical protein